ncbi:ImmA/IrrE family metallo-endopeptidase [Leuconostoc pseudomesenteroides]|uniref:ImmA/IrrE family metallo-endopeptidase n=1 Tax=Leuconostoc pseudomesenteroides TaxID=33968 RepID=UPI0032DFACF4
MKSFENEIEKATELSKQYRELTRHNSLATYNISKSIDALVRNIDLDLEIYFFSFMDKRILGHSMTDKFGTTITLNTLLEYKNNDPRTGFTLAHELGHVVLGHPLGISFPDLNSVKGYERSANVFAANLLMPFEVIVSQIQEGFTQKEYLQHPVFRFNL